MTDRKDAKDDNKVNNITENNQENSQTRSTGRLSLRSSRQERGRTEKAGSVRQSFSHGRSKEVQVEVKRPKRAATGTVGARPARGVKGGQRGLNASEQERRKQVLALALQRKKEEEVAAVKAEQERKEAEQIRIRSAAEEAERQKKEQEDAVKAKVEVEKELEAQKAAEEIEKKRKAEEDAILPPLQATASMGGVQLAPPTQRLRPLAERAVMAPPEKRRTVVEEKDNSEASQTLHLSRGGEEPARGRAAVGKGGGASKRTSLKRAGNDQRRQGRIDIRAAIDGDDGKTRSLASVRRQRDRERRQARAERAQAEQVRIVRDVVIPETITVSELANRMAARQGEVIKALMKLGVMATGPQSIDADMAELIATEFGHRIKRVAESDVELGLEGIEDKPEDLLPRAPIVTVMGHVDHGKTTLLDALRSASVASHESGGITQHIGAYQVKGDDGKAITFIDTPGHEAFTAMRARGASVTDIVVLVVAADDGVMPQTIEAIKHAKAANVPLIIAINKMDKPDVNPDRIRNALLSHEIVVESLGGDIQEVPISALKKQGLDNLMEAILLQAEILDLKANPNRPAVGSVIESRLDRGRGPVVTALVENGTLKVGEIVVVGTEWGRVRALLDDHAKQIKTATPATPVEVLGLSGVPAAGVQLVVVENDSRAREITEFRRRVERDKEAAAQLAARGTLDQMLERIQGDVRKEVSLVIKADVRGSAEALSAMLSGLGNEEVGVRVLNASVGQITESDVQLAKASDAVIIAFNVRATSQARQIAQHEGVDFRYYSVLYHVADDVEALIKKRIAPKHREKFLGYAEIRQVFEITKVGKVAGAYVTDGIVKRGCGVRLLRDNVVIHQGDLSQLKRFKDDVREVTKGYECGLSFEGYNNIQVGDVVECYEMEVVEA
ncbi:translation initiation factor IF-2 [Acetobacteraceae bacterium]|nr:translation initiation factor IF-2 [Acetobacteraceae bacterium]